MARIKIRHTTEYTYRNPVGLLRHRLMVRPDDSHDLKLHGAELKVEPEPASVHWKHDAFDNSICFLEWPRSARNRSPQHRFHAWISRIIPTARRCRSTAWTPSADLFPFSYAQNEIPDLAHLAERQMPDPDRKVDTWARRIVAEAGSTNTLDVLEAMTRAIQRDFRYGARHEEGTQSAAQTIELGTGTCRDFAVLMMEALRSFGLATRFVTGYLYDDTSGTTRGGGSTHAWCSVYLPGAGWVEYDPTNGLVAGANLIRVGVTREASQAHSDLRAALSAKRTTRSACLSSVSVGPARGFV